MNNSNKKKQSNNNSEPKEFEFFTNGKDYYHGIYFEKAKRNFNAIENNSGEESKMILKQFLWKGDINSKNDSGTTLTIQDVRIIELLKDKISHLRDFHCHYWHDNAMMKFEEPLRSFVDQKWDDAYNTLILDKDVNDSIFAENKNHYKVFDKKNEGYYITQEGRLFLLSFFLFKGEMVNLLQYSRGSKNTSAPEYKFKYQLYTYYCHRIGSSLYSVEHSATEESLLQLDAADKKKANAGKMALKILNYLNELPSFLDDTRAFYLQLNSGQKVVSCEDLKQYIADSNIFPFISHIEVKGYEYEKAMIKNDMKLSKSKQQKILANIENKERIGELSFWYKGNEDYRLEISFPALFRITQYYTYIKNILLKKASSTPDNKSHFELSIISLIQRRQYLFELFTHRNGPLKARDWDEEFVRRYFYPADKPNDGREERYSIEHLCSFPIGPTPKIQRKLAAWGKVLRRKGNENLSKRNIIIHHIKPKNYSHPNFSIKHDIEPEPIRYNLGEFYRGLQVRQRKEDKFLQIVARFISDIGDSNNCEWATTKYTSVQKFKRSRNEEKTRWRRQIEYHKLLPTHHRFHVINNNILLRIRENTEGVWRNVTLGKKSLIYLMYWHFESVDSHLCLDDFFAVYATDLNNIFKSYSNPELTEWTADKLRLLEKHHVPKFLFNQTTTSNNEDRRSSTLHRFQLLKEELRNYKSNLGSMSRYQKAELLKNLYKYYDFSDTLHGKFLRKNEYKLISVVHHLMNQSPIKAYKFLEKCIVNGVPLKKRLPDTIINKIEISKDLDDLVTNIIAHRLDRINAIINNLSNANIPLGKIINDFKKEFNQIGKKAKSKNISIVKDDVLQNLPIGIHPSTIIKYFDRENYDNKRYLTSEENPQAKNVSRNIISNNKFNRYLNEELYAWDTLLHDNVPMRKHIYQEKLKNAVLSRIFEQYLNIYQPEIAETIKNKMVRDIDVSMLFKEKICRKINLDNDNNTKVYIELRTHQADDLYVRTMKSHNLKALLSHYLKRRNFEIEYYSDAEQIRQSLETNLPDGSSEDKAIPIGLLINEQRIINNDGKQLMKYIWNYEKKQVNDIANTSMTGGNRASKNDVLCQNYYKDRSHFHINFNEVLDHANIPSLKTELINLRNEILHQHIPNEPYRKVYNQYNNNPLNDILDIKQIFKDRRHKSIYDSANAL